MQLYPIVPEEVTLLNDDIHCEIQKIILLALPKINLLLNNYYIY